MKRKVFITILLVCSVAFCIAAVADIDGKWSATLKPGDGSEIPVTYSFKVTGDTFTGNLAFPDNDFPITNGKIKGDSITFSVAFNGNDIPNSGRVYADSIGLDVVLSDMKFHNTLKREAK